MIFQEQINDRTFRIEVVGEVNELEKKFIQLSFKRMCAALVSKDDCIVMTQMTLDIETNEVMMMLMEEIRKGGK